ncbi:mediator of DNA damage checkpoint protein 1-like [Neodiprion fabricii]|uniref:mediator of DNA damage checkpoint protein 1-like n=1 Tax=Neodiprion fabricii TaxID=2872261 RepID=UPI001ED8C1CA|nr:mediator of DNA damage checkpoint protein 1-like [Neodiprion fabricii]XP_046427547.1 mediator of DNA damage checkpoint protein 1-like [Neodiprion fabricii]
MDYPATQVFVNDDDDKSEDDENDAATPLRAEKNIKIGTLVVDSDVYPVCRGFNKVGRIDSCGIVIGHDTISKEHAEIEAGLGPKSTFISDLGSLNKTRLNDAVLRPGRLYQLQNGDVLRFGSVRAVFKVDQSRDCENTSKEFVVPETPALTAKKTPPIIPGTPDLSFEDVVQDKSTDANLASDVSLVAGTQQGGNTTRQMDTEKSDIPKVNDLAINISELETQTAVPVSNSDEDEDEEEENIFDMMTQKTGIHDYETQKFPAEKGSPIIKSLRDIHDRETQEFSVDEGRPNATKKAEPLRTSINDLETQQFSIVEGRSLSADDAEPHSRSINDLETQRFPTVAKSNSHSINNVQTKRCPANRTAITRDGDDDSETDEEGLFEDSGGGIIDMFDAPTQLVGRPDKENRPRHSYLETESKEDVGEVTVEEKRQPDDEAEITRREEESKRGDEKTSAEVSREDAKPKPNDSIESKLNNMFDDVNDSGAEEPTQMLTQHLERILESTQIEEPDIEDDKLEITGKDDDEEELKNGRKSDEMRSDEKATVSRRKTLSTPEIFAGLPPIDILRWSANDSRSTSEESDAVSLDLIMSSKSRRTKKSRLNSSELSEQSENVKLVDAKNSKSSKPSKPTSKSGPKSVKVTKNEQIVESPKANGTSLRGSTRTKPKPVSTPLEIDVKVSHSVEEESVNAVKKRLPPKKRRFSNSLLSAAGTPPSSPITEVAQSPRASTRSKTKNKDRSSEPSKKSSSIVVRSVNISLGDELPIRSPEAKMPSSATIKVNSVKPESPTLASPVLRRGARSRKSDTGSEPEPMVRSKRLRKNTREEDEPSSPPTPAKKARTKTAEERKKEKSSSKNSKQPVLAVEKPSTPRTRSMRHTETSALVSENENATQSSLESQEIQAILGNANREGNKSRVEQMRASRTRESGLKGLPLGEKSFEIPVVVEPKSKKKVAVSIDASVNKTVAKVQITMEKFVKPKPPPRQPPAVTDSEVCENGRSLAHTRGKRLLASRKTVEKENSTEEIKPKRGRRGTAAVTKRTKTSSSASSSESLDEEMKPVPGVSSPRRGRSSMLSHSPPGRTKYRILFTGLNDPQLVAIVHNLGGTVTEKPGDCTTLVTDKVRRTYKFLCAMAMAVPIVPIDWLRESGRRGCFLDTRDFLLEDPAEEAKFKFNLRRSLEMGKNHGLLEGYTIVLTPNTAPPPVAEMKGIIQACGGKVLVRPPTTWPNKSLIISRSEDLKNAKKYLTKAPKSVRLLSVEFILTGILRHELNFDEHKLDVE